MAAWRAGNTVPRAEAIKKIEQIAREKGYNGIFKVHYDNAIIEDPEDLPANVDMSKVKVSASLNQA